MREDVLAEAEDIKSRGDAEIEKREIDLLKKLGVIKRNRLLDKVILVKLPALFLTKIGILFSKFLNLRIFLVLI